MKKEIYIFTGIFLFLAIGMHFREWTTHPLEHIMALSNASVYGLGIAHPIIFTMIVYVLVYVLRFIISLFKR